MSRGDWVTVRAWGNQNLKRRVVAVEHGRVYVCTDEEFRAAQAHGREPLAVGFTADAVLAEA